MVLGILSLRLPEEGWRVSLHECFTFVREVFMNDGLVLTAYFVSLSGMVCQVQGYPSEVERRILLGSEQVAHSGRFLSLSAIK